MFEQYKDVVNVSDLTEMLGISKKTAYNLVNSGDIKSFMFLASINPSSTELNFPSTPIPLMGFHG